MALSDTKLRKLLGKEQDPCILTHRDSLRVQVSKKGTITWQYRFRFDGKQVILTMGRYPGMSIKEAQSHIPEFQNWLAQGRDPRIEYQVKQSYKSELPRLDALTRQWLEVKVPDLKEKTQGLYQNHAKKWIYPYFNDKSLPVDEMRLLDWVAYFDKVKAAGSAKIAAVMLVRIKTIVRWAYKRGELHNQCPVLNLNTNDVGEPPAKGQRVLSLSELA
ncbi:integrase arm-type DNA-binding domain-containing protein [Pseudoalteromonas sp. T1lg88]|uniref:integrase arm-type DNA-binding domain-containing protein n=1 Tax=Pseudoalteromonas sp. T1lg88 TaxID=2077104 RepID=UPI001F24597D|nr:integrase arm-type DNA-binding domain-containing protein [Pseudoalteromonas sp. T1lg88]